MKNRFMSLGLILLVLFVVFMGFRYTLPQVSPAAMPKDLNRLHFTLIPSVKKTFGYNIYFDGKLLVHQPNVPVLRGIHGFKNREDAGKVARMVIEKIKDGEMPPVVTIEEMNKLGCQLN